MGHQAEVRLFHAEFPSNFKYKRTCTLKSLEEAAELDVEKTVTAIDVARRQLLPFSPRYLRALIEGIQQFRR